MVAGIAHVVTKEADDRKTRKGSQELGLGNRRVTEGRRACSLLKVGIGNLLEERQARGQLLARELIDVGVGDSNVRHLGTRVTNLERQVGGEFRLDDEVSLLGVAGTERAVHAENSLTQSRLGGERDRRYGRAGGEIESRVDAVERPLAHRLNEGKLGIRKGRRYAGLLDPDEAVG